MVNDSSGEPLTSSEITLDIFLVNSEDTALDYRASLVTKTAEAYYYAEITALVRGTYSLLADIYDSETNELVGRIGNTPFEVYWDSHYAYNEFSTIDGPALTIVYTSIVDVFQLTVRDQFENLYNAENHGTELGVDP